MGGRRILAPASGMACKVVITLRVMPGEMEVISHDNVGVHSPTEFFARFARDADKRTARAGRGEDVVPEVAAACAPQAH